MLVPVLGAMAQLVARLVRNEKVGGSNPPSSTTRVFQARFEVGYPLDSPGEPGEFRLPGDGRCPHAGRAGLLPRAFAAATREKGRSGFTVLVRSAVLRRPPPRRSASAGWGARSRSPGQPWNSRRAMAVLACGNACSVEEIR